MKTREISVVVWDNVEKGTEETIRDVLLANDVGDLERVVSRRLDSRIHSRYLGWGNEWIITVQC